MQVFGLPLILRMCYKEWRRKKIISVWIALMRPEFQVFRQRGGRDLGLYRSTGEERWPVPFGTSFGIGIDPARDHAAACFPGLRELVIRIPFDGLSRLGIQLTLVIVGELFPAPPPAVWRIALSAGLKSFRQR